MNKYKVKYIAGDNDAWISKDCEAVVEANSKEEAEEIVRGWGGMCAGWTPYGVTAEEIKDDKK